MIGEPLLEPHVELARGLHVQLVLQLRLFLEQAGRDYTIGDISRWSGQLDPAIGQKSRGEVSRATRHLLAGTDQLLDLAGGLPGIERL